MNQNLRMHPAKRLWQFADAARLTTYLLALWKLFKHPETPRAAKWMAIAVVAYAVSPIDLIPDFIPVLGQLDELVLIPLGIAAVVKLTPAPLWEARLREAETSTAERPRLLWGAAAIVAIWLVGVGLAGWGVWILLGRP
jgi:uncharacterized membrane protein YkvA (DUF1232 family)